jgi:heat shock protein HslJ
METKMKKLFFLLLMAVVWIMSCGSTPNVPVVEGRETNGNSSVNSTSNVTDVTGNEWKLIVVYVNGTNTGFNRDTLPEELRNFFTVKFDGGSVSGVGAPNLYSAPYTMGDSQIGISLMRSTMMASFFQPENLTEHEYFTYMQNAREWKLVNNNLELLSKTENGSEVRLVFSL